MTWLAWRLRTRPTDDPWSERTVGPAFPAGGNFDEDEDNDDGSDDEGESEGDGRSEEEDRFPPMSPRS